MSRTKLLCYLLFVNSLAYGAAELDFDFGYDKQVYGVNRESDYVTRTYSGSFAFYLFNATGIELNYSNSEDIDTNNAQIELTDNDIVRLNMQSKVSTEVLGIGIRQALSGRSSMIRPLISIGYAKQTSTYKYDAKYREISSGIEARYKQPATKSRYDSVFASFMVQIRLVRGLALKGSIKTVFPAFKFDKAQDNLKYLVGFTWVF